MKQFKLIYIPVMLLLWVYPIMNGSAQNLISGSVTDQMGQPISGADITVLEDSAVHSTTGMNGTFTIRLEKGQHLQINADDYHSKVIPVKSGRLNISLKTKKNYHLGYGETVRPGGLTGSVGRVGADQLSESSFVMNAENALIGQVPGLMVLQNGGATPSSSNILIRGRGTFTDSSPLILIDGFEQPFYSSTNFGGISVNEIQSVMVLKDAAALAKYGQRGANGVLLIRTKRGNKSGLQVHASMSTGITRPTNLPSFVNAPDYARAINEALRNDGQSPRYGNAEITAFEEGNSPYLYPDVDWFDEVLRESGARSNFNVSFQGGGENARFFATLNLVNDNGVFGPVSRNEDYSTQLKNSRFNIRSNLDIDLSDRLLLRLDVSGNLFERNLPSGGSGTPNIFNALYSIPAGSFPVKTPSGNWGGTQTFDNNPVAILTDRGYGEPNSRQYSLNGSLDYDLSRWIPGLSAEIGGRYYSFSSFLEQYTKSFRYEAISPVRDQDGEIVDTASTIYGQDTDLNFVDSFGSKLNYTDIFGNITYQSQIGSHSKLESTLLFHQSVREIEGLNNKFHRRNIAGKMHLNMRDKYYFTLSASYSGNNLLPYENRYNFFPAVSASWLMSEEDFLQDLTFLDYVKLRGSFGISGSDLLPANNPYEQSYNRGSGYWFRLSNIPQGGFEEGRLASTDFDVEKSYKANIGLELLLVDRLQLSADLFYNRRTNILTDSEGSISDVIGIEKPLESDGIVDNKGVEVAATWRDQIGDFRYNLGGQFTFARNEIVDMNERFRPHEYLRRTGKRVGQSFGLEVVGFFEDQEDIENSPTQVFSEVEPGDIKYKDQNGDGIINEFDEVPIGYATGYPEIYFSADIGFGYKNFNVSALFQGTANYSAYLNTQSVYWPLINNTNISDHYFDNRWTPETRETASLPRLTTENNDNNFRPNSIWLADRSFIKLRSLVISYTLPASVTGPWGIDEVRIYTRGMNLFSIDNIEILDPEHLGVGYPILKSYSAGIEVSF